MPIKEHQFSLTIFHISGEGRSGVPPPDSSGQSGYPASNFKYSIPFTIATDISNVYIVPHGILSKKIFWAGIWNKQIIEIPKNEKYRTLEMPIEITSYY